MDVSSGELRGAWRRTSDWRDATIPHISIFDDHLETMKTASSTRENSDLPSCSTAHRSRFIQHGIYHQV